MGTTGTLMRSSTLQLDAMVSIKAHIPDDAMSASLLGTERTGHGARIRDDGLIATIGYVISEAESVWIGANNGVLVPGFAVGYDFDSGFGLVMPTMPMEGPTFELGTTASLQVGTPVTVTASGKADQIVHAEIVAKREFAGRWEYLLDEAIFTSPPHESWSGAALIDGDGRLCGLGSLLIPGLRERWRRVHGQHVRAHRPARADHRRHLQTRPSHITATAVAWRTRSRGPQRPPDNRRRLPQLPRGQGRAQARRCDSAHRRRSG